MTSKFSLKYQCGESTVDGLYIFRFILEGSVCFFGSLALSSNSINMLLKLYTCCNQCVKMSTAFC
jgi:hypothetical protein